MRLELKNKNEAFIMKKLLQLAELIDDKELKNKTIELLKDVQISNMHFKKYKRIEFKNAYGGPSDFHHAYKGGLLEHVYSVTSLCIDIAKNLEKSYNVKISMDYLISGALLHDIMKIFCFRESKGNVEHTGVTVDHGIWACCELYLRDFPEEVIHIIASHFGPNGPNPPQTIEALILFYADNIDTTIDTLIHPKKEKVQVVVLK